MRPPRRIRLIDAVILAAGAMLVLKLAAYLASPPTVEVGPDGLPRFARVLAHARSNYRPADPETTGSVPDKAAKPAAEGGTGAGGGPAPVDGHPAGAEPKSSPSERAIRERLSERREELARRARELETREKLIEEAERRAEAKSEEVRAAEERGAAALAPGAREAANLKGLVVMYEAMKPKDAARVFDRLPEDVLVPVARRIAPRKMAEIMAAMSSEAAQKLTVALARPAAQTPPEAPVAGLPPGELPAIEPARAAGRPAG